MTNTNELNQNWGGKRKNAGRKKTGRTTKVIRVPLDFPDTQLILDTIETLQTWNEKSNQSSQTSVRWERLRQLLGDIHPEILGSNDNPVQSHQTKTNKSDTI